MTREELRERLLNIKQIGSLSDKDREALNISIKALEQEPISPCDVCRYNPPSSGDGKPCTMCPAEREDNNE